MPSTPFEFSDVVHTVQTDNTQEFVGSVQEGRQYKIVVTRYDESNEKTGLLINSSGNPRDIVTRSQLISPNDPFIVERHFTAPCTGNIIYSSLFISNKTFLSSYPTLEAFIKDCQNMTLTQGGNEILNYEQEYQVQLSMPDTVRVSVNLFEVA